MRLRPYIASLDYEVVSRWITDARTNALWCAGQLPFPFEREPFDRFLQDMARQNAACPFVAATDEGQLIGFFLYSADTAANEGKFRCIMVDPACRGRGFGREMLRLAVKYAFEITKVQTVQLNVFSVNTGAVKCYEAVGFTVRERFEDALRYENEVWERYNMVLRP